MLLNCALCAQKGNLSKWSIFGFLFFCSVTHILHSDRHWDPYEVSITYYGSLLYKQKISVCTKLALWHFNFCFTLEAQICDEISWRGGNFVTHTNKFFLGPRWFLMKKSLNSHLGSEFRQPLKKTKYEVTLQIFGGKNYFVLKVWRN